MEHVLCECLHYSQLLWIRVGDIIQLYLNPAPRDLSPRVELSQLNVIYNVPHPSPLLHIPDKITRNAFIILTQEIKHNITYQRINLPHSARLVKLPKAHSPSGHYLSIAFTPTFNTLVWKIFHCAFSSL
jgi:hypothetical protein